MDGRMYIRRLASHRPTVVFMRVRGGGVCGEKQRHCDFSAVTAKQDKS